MRQKSWFFGKDFFHVTDLHSSPKTTTTILQWFQRRVLGFLKMDKVELRFLSFYVLNLFALSGTKIPLLPAFYSLLPDPDKFKRIGD
ncbi:hypothetical protein NIES3974_35210 [Calothrix sp. NIES-3974]|nr:hypothetical protein NIES3974_35210 [Calothrix sp. NIES-3974]